MDGGMDGWMDGEMDGWIDGRSEGGMDGWICGYVDQAGRQAGKACRQTDKWPHEGSTVFDLESEVSKYI